MKTEAGDGVAKAAWRTTLPLLVVALAAVIVVFWDTFASMVAIWVRSETFTHGFIVPPISVWLIWRRRAQLQHMAPSPSPWVLAPILIAGMAWLVGDLASANSLTQLAATTILVLSAIAVVGIRVARAIAFPLAFLFFAVPLGEFFLPRLMEWTADFTVTALRLTGIPVYREGLSFVIPSGNWSVVEACSGVRYLIASLMVGTLFAYLNYRSLQRRLIFVVVSAVVPILANWVRAYLIVMLGHLSGNKLAAGADHLVYGWVFFGLVIMLMFMIGARWSEDPKDDIIHSAVDNTHSTTHVRTAGTMVALLLALSLPIIAAKWVASRAEGSAPILPFDGDHAVSDWQPYEGLAAVLSPNYRNPSNYVSLGFEKGGVPVGLYIAYYRNQNRERKLISSTNSLITSQDPQWVFARNGEESVGLGTGQIPVKSYELAGVASASRSANSRLRVWQWYWIDGHITADETRASLYSVLSLLEGRGDDAATVIVYTPMPESGNADAQLAAFVRDLGPKVNEALRNTRDTR